MVKPVGQPTRGKTARNRLRRVDVFTLLYDPGLLRRRDGDFWRAWFVDLGYGADPTTTLESATRFRRLNPDLPVLGVEIDGERVAAVQPFADDLTQFRLGGFNLPLGRWPDGEPERVRLIRAFNVLRQYDEDAVIGAHGLLGEALLPGGLLIEGTAEPFGRLWTANVLRRGPDGLGLRPEGLLFSTNFRLGFAPADFQPVLPKNYIHRMRPGEWVFELMEAWKRAALETAAMQVWGPRQWFVASAERLAGMGFGVLLRSELVRKGFLMVNGEL